MLSDPALRKPLAGWLAFGALMCLAPFVVGTGTVRIFIFANYVAIFAMSWDVISGRTGYISFGQPFLIGLAAYTTGMLSYHLDVPLYLTIPASVLVAMAGGILFFVPALRTRGTYFALVTLAFMELMYQLTQVIAPKVTGGSRGLSGIPHITSGALPNFYLSFGIMFAVAVALWLLMRTRLGTALSALRMDEGAVAASGISKTRLKLFAFSVSAMVAGIGGAFYTHYLGSVAPRALFDINFLFLILVSALIGGMGTIIGPIMGAYFLTFLLEYSRHFIPGTERYMIYGVIVLLVYVFRPDGLYSLAAPMRQLAAKALGQKR